MDQDFISKIKIIILQHLEDEKFGVKELGSLIGLSRSQLLRNVKASTGKSANEFINDIRLEEGVKLIKETNYTFSEIAYKVGYSSPSYFFKCFHDHFGCTPTEYKTLDKKAKERVTLEAQKPKHAKLKSIVLVLTILLVILITYVIFNNVTHQKTIHQTPSLAILPFKILSDEKENEFLADGIWDDILNHVSKIKTLDVRSRQSLERYRLSKKSMSAIGEELDATYIVETSFQIGKDTLRIITQLIDAKTDTHVWSDEFNYKLKDIFRIECDIAKEIAQQLNVALTADDVKSFETFPTTNQDAYQLFLKGKAIADHRSKENLEAGIELFKQAIALDPNFAEVYAEMAHLYLLLGALSLEGIDMDKIEALNEQALKIDSNTVRVYTSRGFLNLGRGQWEEGMNNYEKAISLNPNDVTAHHHYALLLARKPLYDGDNYLAQTKIAQKLDPYSEPINNELMYALLDNKKIQEAEKHYNKISFKFSNAGKVEFKGLIKSLQNKDFTETINGMLEAVKLAPNDADLHLLLAGYYNDILNDDVNCLKHCKIAYELDSMNPYRRRYFRCLLENKKLTEAHEILMDTNYMNTFTSNDKHINWAEYYDSKGDFAEAFKYIDSTNTWFKYSFEVTILAQMGDIEGVNAIFKEHEMRYSDKARVYAILKEKDSMYYYLNKITSIFRALELNGENEFNPYRNEPKFKAYLKKHYLPVGN